LIKQLDMLQGKQREALSNLSKALNENSDLQSENCLLRNQLEDSKAMLLTHESNKQAMTREIMDVQQESSRRGYELEMLRNSFDSLTLNADNGIQEAAVKERMWTSREKELNDKLQEMTRRLKKAAEEYEERYKYSIKIESKLFRLQSKVDKYVGRPRSAFVAFPSPSPAAGGEVGDSFELLGHTEAKTLLRDELAASKEEKEDDLGLVTLPCSVCKEDILCTIKDLRPMTLHLEEYHKQRVCPVCSQLFDATMPCIDDYFHAHVEDHFNTPRYPTTEAPQQ